MEFLPIEQIKPNILTPVIIEKGWGYEEILCSNEEYCGKILNIKKDYEFSTHYHISKAESWYVLSGRLKLVVINLQDASKHDISLIQGMVVEIPRLLPHKLIALEDSRIVEFSTKDDPKDSFRVEPGSSQK